MDNPAFTSNENLQHRKSDGSNGMEHTAVRQGESADATESSSRSSSSDGSHRSPRGSQSQDSNHRNGLERNLPAANDAIHLERRVGLVSGVALIVGTMIGSGIFVSSSDLLARTQSPGLCLVIWTACGLLSLFGSLAYAELGTMIPKSGGEYAYFLEAFGPGHKFWGPVMSFLYSWVSVLLLRTSSMAIICLSFAQYLLIPTASALELCSDPDTRFTVLRLLAALAICLITFVNCFSVTLATKVQNVFTAAKLVAIAIIIIGGLYMIAIGNVQYLNQGFDGSTTSFGDIATAFYSGLWAYDGWNNLNYVTEELKNPYVNLPRAIIIGIPLTTVCYVLVNVAYLSVLSPDEMINSEAVAVLWGQKVLGPAAFLMPLGVVLSTFGAANGSTFTAGSFGGRTLGVMAWLMPLAVCISTFGSANGTLFVGGRLCYVASREGHLVDILSYVHIRRLTPSPALLFNSFIALLMIIPGDIGSLIDFFSFTAWIFYGSAMVALLVLRYTRPDAPRPYKVPIVIPILVLLISLYLVIGPIVDNPKIEYLYATLFILAGFIFYVPFVHYKLVMPGMGKITTFFQMLLEVCPSAAVED